MDGRLRRLAVVFHVIAAPVLQDRRFSQADQSFVGFQLDDDIDSDGRGQACPLVNSTRGEFDGNRFNAPDFHSGTSISWSVGVASESSSHPFSVTATMSLFCSPMRPGI